MHKISLSKNAYLNVIGLKRQLGQYIIANKLWIISTIIAQADKNEHVIKQHIKKGLKCNL